MPTDAEKIATAITQTIDRIIEVTESTNPDWIDQGRRVDTGEYLKILVDKLKTLYEIQQIEDVVAGRAATAIWLGRKTYQESPY